MSHNHLCDKSGEELANALAKIHDSITSLDLSYNFLHNKTNIELITIITAIPKSVTSLNLRGNDLGSRASGELITILAAIPKNITSLNLGDNCLHERSSSELATALAAIPAEITEFNLHENQLEHICTDELIQVFKALPKGIRRITLSLNDITNRSQEDLIALGNALPYVMDVCIVNDKHLPITNDKSSLFKDHIGSIISLKIKEIKPQKDDFDAKLQLIADKINEFEVRKRKTKDKEEKNKLTAAQNEATKLLHGLKKAATSYFNTPMIENYALFKHNCSRYITIARIELNQHRGWKQILGNLALAITGLGLLYVIAGFINKSYTGNFLFFQTDTSKKISLLEEIINQAIPN